MKKRYILFIVSIFLMACSAGRILQGDRIIDAKYYPPSGESKNVAIMILGGSEGGMPSYNTKHFTEKGYPCIRIGYFRTENTPDRLEMIPLEYLEDAIKAFKSQPEVGDKKIVVYGWSKGGELALLLASRYEQIGGVIARVPGSVVFEGPWTHLSSWSYNGEPIPFVLSYRYYKRIANSPYFEFPELSLKQKEAAEKATIEVENINGPILILTGKEDTLWPASQMGEMIIKRLEQKNFPHWYKHFAYENAGHNLSEMNNIPIIQSLFKTNLGGTFSGNKKARIDSQQRIFDFLSRISGGQ